jgi:hypothetical protein
VTLKQRQFGVIAIANVPRMPSGGCPVRRGERALVAFDHMRVRMHQPGIVGVNRAACHGFCQLLGRRLRSRQSALNDRCFEEHETRGRRIRIAYSNVFLANTRRT